LNTNCRKLSENYPENIFCLFLGASLPFAFANRMDCVPRPLSGCAFGAWSTDAFGQLTVIIFHIYFADSVICRIFAFYK